MVLIVICIFVITANTVIYRLYAPEDQIGPENQRDFDLLYHVNAVSDSPFPSELILNRTKFTFTINPAYSICRDTESNEPFELLLLAMVPIAPNRFQDRSLIRSTWAKRKSYKPLRTVFIIGTTSDNYVMEEIQKEVVSYNDIVQADFEDTYMNLTHKTMAGIKWATTYCSNAKFLLKVDDDVVVNTGSLLIYLANESELSNSFVCHVNYFAHVVRNAESKFYVSYNMYNYFFYPIYCDGPAYIMTMDLAARLYGVSRHFAFFPFEDIFTTGIIPRKLKPTPSYVNLGKRYNRLVDFKIFNLLKYPFTKYFVYVSSLNDYLNAWKLFS